MGHDIMDTAAARRWVKPGESYALAARSSTAETVAPSTGRSWRAAARRAEDLVEGT